MKEIESVHTELYNFLQSLEPHCDDQMVSDVQHLEMCFNSNTAEE